MALVKRSERLGFMEVGETPTYERMTNFTELSRSANAKEYSRQYVDEDFERSSISGYSPSYSYAFDLHDDVAVHKEIADITDHELVGDGAKRNIVVVALDRPVTGKEGSYEAVLRPYSIIPDSDGNSTDCYTYSGTFKADGDKVFGTATTTDGWQTAVFTENQE